MRSIKTNKNNKDMEETELVLEMKPLSQSKQKQEKTLDINLANFS